jgi:hypothetical protein
MAGKRPTRRRLMALGLGGAVGLGLAPKFKMGGRAMAAENPQTMVYVSNAGSKEVFALAMDRATGALDLIEKTPVPGTDKPSPASLPMTTSRDKRFLYAQLRSEPYPVSTFAIERPSGKLRHLAATPLVDQMAYINTDNSGRYLLAASYVGAKLGIYPINPETHIVEPKATQFLDTKPKAHCVYVGKGNSIYVPVLGGDEVLELTLDPATGTVKPNGPGKVDTKANAGPRHFTIHPNGKWAYLITETTATIGLYNIDPATGQLSETPLRRGAHDQHAARLQDRSRQRHADADRQVRHRKDTARLQYRPARQVPLVGGHGFERDDGLRDRPVERRAHPGGALPDGHAAQLDRDRRSEIASPGHSGAPHRGEPGTQEHGR